MKLSVNTGFLVNRYPDAQQWCQVIKELGVKNIQITADLLNPNYPDHILKEEIKNINTLKDKYCFNVYSGFTGAFTRVNHFCHPNQEVREYWLDWFTRFGKYCSLIGAKKVGSHIGIISTPDNKNNRQVYQKRCLDYWKLLAERLIKNGIEELTWEHMSIEREQGHTCNDIDNIINGLKDSVIPITMCLDPDHGDLTSNDSKDYEPYFLINRYIKGSSQIHLKQTSQDKRKNGPFTPEKNKDGLINATKVINLICEKKIGQSKEDLELVLEINARERDPEDSEIIDKMHISLEYWRKALIAAEEQYE